MGRWQLKEQLARASAQAALETVLTWLLTSTIPLIGVLLASHLSSQLREVRWPVGIAAGAGIGLLSLRVRRRQPSIYKSDYPSVDFRYEVLERTISYRIDQDGVLRYSKKIRVRALQNNLDEFIDKYWWTGGKVSLPTGGENVVRVDPINDRVGAWQYYRAYFGVALKKGTEIEFEVLWPPITNWVRSSPFASTSTDEPTHLLHFCLQIPPGALSGRRAIKEVLRAAESHHPFESEQAEFDENGRLTWDIPNPPLYRYYRIRWFWSAEVNRVAGEPPTIPGQVVSHDREDERRLET